MRLQSAIFDMDGTLIDSMPAWRSLGPTILRKHEIEPTPEELQQFKILRDTQVVAYLRDAHHLGTTQEILKDMHEIMADFYATTVQPKPGVLKFLSLMKMEGVWMYLATATNRDLVNIALRRTGLGQYFRGILTSGEVGSSKVDSAEIYERAMRRLQSTKRDTVVFEDALHAVQTAKNAGFRVAAVYDVTEPDQKKLQQIADYYIRSFDEMYETNTFE